MPLIHSATKKAFGQNYGELVAAGHPPAQAAAISHDVQREARRRAAMRNKEGGKHV